VCVYGVCCVASPSPIRVLNPPVIEPSVGRVLDLRSTRDDVVIVLDPQHLVSEVPEYIAVTAVIDVVSESEYPHQLSPRAGELDQCACTRRHPHAPTRDAVDGIRE
jgi:hypothetical protein